MDLFDTPFYILGATSRDNKRRIHELAEEKTLFSDSVLVTKAQADLTNPRKRIVAELAWLPGVGPRLASELIDNVENNKGAGQNQLGKLNPLATVNYLLSLLKHRQFDDYSDWTSLGFEILVIAQSFEKVDIQELAELLNAERIAAGFSEINDELLIEENLHERRAYIRQIIKESLNNMPSKDLLEIMKLIVEESTDFGNQHGLMIVEDLVAGYEIEVQDFLETEGNNIESIISNIRSSLARGTANPLIEKLISQLIAVIKNWQLVAEPIQLNAKSRGGEHEKSVEIAKSIRSLGIDMYNEYGQIEYSARLLETIKTFFAEVATIAERVNDDMEVINAISERTLLREVEFAKEITYDTSVGTIFKERLKISPAGIEWRNATWNLEKITRIRWGGIKRSINGIPTGTTYSVFFGSETNFVVIDLGNHQYEKFVDCLWKAVGVNILTDFLKGLKTGKQYIFGMNPINDEGIVLEKHNFFSANERKHFRWNEVVIWNDPGCFCVGIKDRSFSASFSYLDHDNTHVLEIALRALWKNYSPKLSSLLER